MKIVLSGIETNNKGAELMLYAILQEIERKYPDAWVYVPIYAIGQGLSYIHTNLKLRNKPFAKIKKAARKLHIPGILRRLHLPYYFIDDSSAVNDADYFIDASGFAFSDQWKPTDYIVKVWEKQLMGYHKQGTKIIFLPQAFGPANLPNTKKELALLNQYADIIMPREEVSLGYLQQCNVNMKKVRLFLDFTSIVYGQCPKRYDHLKNGVCIIPNLRMIDKGVISLENYLEILNKVIDKAISDGHKVYLLNHEGREDEELAYMCRDKLCNRIEVVTGLNALEVKGLIATSILCITSRFHGAASALNSCVPCLATSWSHKYAELFKGYGMTDCILDVTNLVSCIDKVSDFLSTNKSQEIREHLRLQLPEIQSQTQDMWKCVWSI